MSVNVWFVLGPWLAFVAVLIGVFFWQRTSPHRRRRRTRSDTPDQSGSGGEQEADVGRYESA
jgi:hypothetical protein